MIRYIISLREYTNSYYAGNPRSIENVWTTSAHLATMWQDEDTAIAFMANIATKLQLAGEYKVRTVQVPDIPIYNGVGA